MPPRSEPLRHTRAGSGGSSRGLAALALGLVLASCGGRDKNADAPVQKLTAEGEVLRLGHVWQAMDEERGIRGAPEKIARFEIKRRSTLTFSDGKESAEELLEVKELLELRSGAQFECVTRAKLPVRVRFGRRQGQPAVEVKRPSRPVKRNCRPADFPQPEMVLGGGSARYRLQGEQLVGFAPLGENRVYLPIE